MVEYIGIDIGGTNIKICAIDEFDNVIYTYKEPTYQNVITAEDLYVKIVNLIKNIPNYNQAKAIGIGAPGGINRKSKQVITSKNVSILNNYPLVEKLKNDFNKPVYIENDARVATFAEAVKGRGKDKNIVCYITISTGLGGGVVIDKNIYQGSTNLGAYFSRMILDGKHTSDELISGTAIVRKAKEKIDENIKNTFEVFTLEEQGNEIAVEIINEFKNNLKVLLLNIASTINPDIIVIGGGVMNAKERFFDEVVKCFRNEAHPFVKDTVIETAEFEEPGIYGAALLAKDKVEGKVKDKGKDKGTELLS